MAYFEDSVASGELKVEGVEGGAGGGPGLVCVVEEVLSVVLYEKALGVDYLLGIVQVISINLRISTEHPALQPTHINPTTTYLCACLEHHSNVLPSPATSKKGSISLLSLNLYPVNTISDNTTMSI